MKDILKNVGLGAAGIIYFVASILIGLTLLYFGIKFVIAAGDKFFGDNKKEDISVRQPEPGDLKRSYVGACQEEILKDAPDGTNTDDVRNYCGCLYDAMENDAGGPEKFKEYQNTVSQNRVATITEHCRTAYNNTP